MAIKPSRHKLIARARRMRKNPTLAERIMWEQLRRNQLGCRFHRQKPIGSFIVGFYSPSAKLAIECDGIHHHRNYNQIEADRRRSYMLSKKGIQVLRFQNREIHQDLPSVIAKIKAVLKRK